MEARGNSRHTALWAAFGSLLVIGFALPYIHFTFPYWAGRYQRPAQLAVLGLLVLWFLVRPVAVAVSDPYRPSTPPPPPGVGVSVVIPCCNAARSIEATVRSLLDQTLRPIEIVCVENNSTDSTWERLTELAERHPEVMAYRVFPEPGEYAASVAINHGVERARYDVILRLDDDTHIRSDALAQAVGEMYRTNAVAVACDLRVANPHATVWSRMQSIEYLLAMDMDRRSQSLVSSILCCSGGMAVFRKEVILRAGGFVSEPREVSEDMDMTLKSQRFGHVTIAPEAIGFTRVPESFTDLVRQRFRWAISGTVALYLHRHGVANPRHWHEPQIAFLGLPYRACVAMRDLLAPVYALDVWLLLSHDGPAWLAALLVGRMVLLWIQLVALRPALHRRPSLQGLDSWYLIPFFVLLYGPALLVARFIGSWTALHHVRLLRRRHDRVLRRGLGMVTEPGYGSGREVVRIPDLEPVTRSTTTSEIQDR
jgi:cellulose synthase/poly-beta-1,6-N-acetylglucosamine synthase-like glycosyltransferase